MSSLARRRTSGAQLSSSSETTSANASIGGPTATVLSTNSATPMLDSIRGTLKRGSKGDDVMALQNALNAEGAGLVVDGHFGPKTEAAVRDFQASNGLAVDGIVGPNTRGALQSGGGAVNDAPNTSSRSGAPAASATTHDTGNLELGSNGPRVAELQEKLNVHGARLLVDGDFGPATQRALIAFQIEHGLSGDGVAGPNTWSVLDQPATQHTHEPTVPDWAADIDDVSGDTPVDASDRGELAAKAARLMFTEGQQRYGNGTWETNGSNRGALVDEMAQANYASPAQRYAWCGMFVGRQFADTGIRDEILRNLVFWSGYRLHLFLTQGRYLGGGQAGPWYQNHPTKDLRGLAGEDRERAIKSYSPKAGDIVLFRSDFSHVGMVADYDPQTGTIQVIEGNRGNRVQATAYDEGDSQITFLGRFVDADFDKGASSALVNAEDPRVRHTAASGGSTR